MDQWQFPAHSKIATSSASSQHGVTKRQNVRSWGRFMQHCRWPMLNHEC